MTSAVRTACSVPFCRRSVAGRWAGYLCGDHWRLVDRDLRRLRTKLRRRFMKRGEVVTIKGGWRSLTDRAARAEAGIWRRMVRQAIERATGVSA